MNVFFVIAPKGGGKPELITAPLDGTILPGVTRRTVLELCRNSGDYTVSERALGMKEVSEAAAEGRLMEAFGTGTAAVIAPINCVLFKGKVRLLVLKLKVPHRLCPSSLTLLVTCL